MQRGVALLEPMLVLVVGIVIAVVGFAGGWRVVVVGGAVVAVVGVVVLTAALRQINRTYDAWNPPPRE